VWRLPPATDQRQAGAGSCQLGPQHLAQLAPAALQVACRVGGEARQRWQVGAWSGAWQSACLNQEKGEGGCCCMKAPVLATEEEGKDAGFHARCTTG
jgi:hypothetical protein